jgi:hypothetical protein
MRSIRDVAVFAWAVTGINGTLAHYSQGRPRRGAQPVDGLPVWELGSRPTTYPPPDEHPVTRVDNASDRTKEPSSAGPVFGHGGSFYPPETPAAGYRARHVSLDEGMYDAGNRPAPWAPSTSSAAAASLYPYGGGHEPRAYRSRPPLRPAFSYDALHEHARHQQQACYVPAASEAASRRCIFREEPWTEASSSRTTTVPVSSYGADASGSRGSSGGEPSKRVGAGYFWQ